MRRDQLRRRAARRLECTLCQVEVLEPGEVAGARASVMHRRRPDGRTLTRACLPALEPPPPLDARYGRRHEPLPRRWRSAEDLEGQVRRNHPAREEG